MSNMLWSIAGYLGLMVVAGAPVLMTFNILNGSPTMIIAFGKIFVAVFGAGGLLLGGLIFYVSRT